MPADPDESAMEGESCSEKRFFEERQQVRNLLQKLVHTRLPTPQCDVDREFLADHSTVTQIVRCHSIEIASFCLYYFLPLLLLLILQ